MAKDDKTVSNEEAVNQDEQPGTPIESISLRDLDQIAQIIDLATQRGAFRGGELSTIGQLYDKLATFLIITSFLTMYYRRTKQGVTIFLC